MNKLVINTQYMENYGDLESPYMKFKGGNTFVMFNCGDLTENEIATITAQVRPYITTTLLESNGGCEEYIIDKATMVPQNAKIAEQVQEELDKKQKEIISREESKEVKVEPKKQTKKSIPPVDGKKVKKNKTNKKF